MTTSLCSPFTAPEMDRLTSAATAGRILGLLLEDYPKVVGSRDGAVRALWKQAGELERKAHLAREILTAKVGEIPRWFKRRP